MSNEVSALQRGFFTHAVVTVQDLYPAADKFWDRNQQMLTRIRYYLRMIWRRVMKRCPKEEEGFIADEIVYTIPLQGDRNFPDLKGEPDFRDCPGSKEYSQDILSIFKGHRIDFLLDYTHEDGHFRV